MVWVGIALLAVFVASAVFGSRGWMHLCRLHQEQAEVEALAVRLERQNAALDQHIRRLDGDDTYLEKVVRERIHWVKPNEMLYRADGSGSGEVGAAEGPAGPKD